MLDPDQIPVHARRYAKRRGITLVSKLGSGQDGWVGKSDEKTALKFFERQRPYRTEVRCYERLASHGIESIDGFDIPSVIRVDDLEMVIEMDIVQPPFILDFGKAHIDLRPDFSEHTMLEHQARQRELWDNDEQWAQIRSIVWQLESIGIYYLDTKPGNIAFAGQKLN